MNLVEKSCDIRMVQGYVLWWGLTVLNSKHKTFREQQPKLTNIREYKAYAKHDHFLIISFMKLFIILPNFRPIYEILKESEW